MLNGSDGINENLTVSKMDFRIDIGKSSLPCYYFDLLGTRIESGHKFQTMEYAGIMMKPRRKERERMCVGDFVRCVY